MQVMVTPPHMLVSKVSLKLGPTSGLAALQEGVMGTPAKRELTVEIMSRATCSPPLLGATESTPENTSCFDSLG